MDVSDDDDPMQRLSDDFSACLYKIASKARGPRINTHRFNTKFHKCRLFGPARDMLSRHIYYGICLDCRRAIKQYMMISARHPYTRRYAPSSFQLKEEEYRHLIFYNNAIHPFSMFTFHYEFVFMFVVMLQMIANPFCAMVFPGKNQILYWSFLPVNFFTTTMPPKVMKRANWTEEQLQAAIRAVQHNRLSQREAAQRYKIPRRTLRNHLKSGILNKKIGRSSVLTPEQEVQFSERIVRVCEIGMPLTPLLVRRSVYTFCIENNIPHPFDAAKGIADDSTDNIPVGMLRNIILQEKSRATPVETNKATKIQEKSQDLNKSFKELLPTPELFKLKENKAPRIKSLNYRAQMVTKDLFSPTSGKSKSTLSKKDKIRNEPIASSSKMLQRKGQKDILAENDSCYCFVCNKSEKLDMRRCVSCGTWSHEICIGFTKDDKDGYICVRCD
ncbi:unnamed protein product [Ceutorhynchus assimilis]|uniref:HTH psq-type domain-containing protein n=1 Tax=Ceutorhynchus assimilis TaxID=467358 RepID=A0A9N9MKW6_9CUCU|nr:unnamed protein product [Ceutorhynchus assimilis]